MSAPSPIILLLDSNIVLLRDSERWVSYSAIDFVNHAMSPELPLATYARFMNLEDGYDVATNTLSITANWGWMSGRVKLRAEAALPFTWLSMVLAEEAGTAIPEIASSGMYHVQMTHEAHLEIWHRQEVNLRLPFPPPVLSLPAGCPVESPLNCAVAKVHVTPLKTVGDSAQAHAIDWVGVTWPAEPRRYASEIHSVRYGSVIHFDSEFVEILLGGIEIDNVSVRMGGVGRFDDSGRNIEQVWFKVEQAPISNVASSSLRQQHRVITVNCPGFQLKFQLPGQFKLSSQVQDSDEIDFQIQGFPEQCTRTRPASH